MSYWHIVDALLVYSFFRDHKNLVRTTMDKATASNVCSALLNVALNVFFVAYLIQNIHPDIIMFVHGLCHG